jgi:proton glutamate symport protein
MAISASQNPTLLAAADSVAPIGTLWVNAIRMTVIPLVVSLLITSVASVSDISMIGRLGGRTLAVFLAMLAGATALSIPLAIAVFSFLSQLITVRPELPAGAADAASSVAAGAVDVGFSSWVTSLIPTNPVAAAASGAMLPLVLFTLLLALAIGRTPPASRETLLGFFRALSEAMLVLVRWVVGLAPIGFFALMLPLGAHGGAGLAGALGFYIAAYSIASALFTLLLYPAVAMVARIPIRDFARAALPMQLIAFSSSSSIASLPAMVEAA